MASTLNSRAGFGNAAASVAIAVAAMIAAALAATGAAAAAGVTVLLATSAAVVVGGTEEPADLLRRQRVPLVPAQHTVLDNLPELIDESSVAVATVRQGRRVRFNLTQNTVHEITPYSEIYGMHPRLLRIRPGAENLEPIQKDDSDEEECFTSDLSTWVLECLRRGSSKAVKFWPLGICLFWLRAFGAEALLAAWHERPGVGRASRAMAKMPPWAQPPAAPEPRQRLWELGLQHHQKALEGVTKFTDQSTPIGHTTLCKARARARENARDEQRRDIHAENLHLASRLKEIVQKPGTLSTAPHSLQREQMREEMLRRDRQIRQKNIQHENRFLVQRLLSVKSSLDVHGLEKDYRRHRNEVGRMQQLRKKLPKLQAPLAEVKSSSRTSGFRPSRQHAALTQSSSAPLLQALPGRLAPSNVPNQAVARSPVSSSIESEAEVNPCLNVIEPREVADATKETDSDGICERRAYQEDVPAYVAALLLRCLALEATPEQAAHEQEQAAPEKAAQEREPAEPEQAEPEHAEPEQAEPEQAAQEQEQAEPEQAEPEQAAPEQAAQEQEQAAPEQATPEQAPGSPAHVFTNLAMEVIHELTSEAPRNTSLAAEVVHDLTADALAALDERAMSTATSWTVQFNSTMESFSCRLGGLAMPGAPSSAAAQAAAAKAQAAQRAEAQERLKREIVAATCYPNEAADYFQERYAHRLRWAHAVNSQRLLRAALTSNSHFIEADVSAGPLIEERDGRRAASVVQTSVRTASDLPLIMAHYPTQRSSDLCFEHFLAAVLKHNAQVDGDFEDETPSSPSRVPQRSPFSEPVIHAEHQEDVLVRSASEKVEDLALRSSHCQEAAAFAVDLHKELETLNHNEVVMACIGARRASNHQRAYTKKGIKLDFKVFESVEPALRHLQSTDAARKLGGHLWLNADVFAGPGYPERFLSPIDARRFVQLCAERVPDAVLSLSWGSSSLSTSRSYTADMVNRMIELCMSPIVPRALEVSPKTQVPEQLTRQELPELKEEHPPETADQPDKEE
ncbi:unnamed protein product, partial [Effrenium voratum]